MTVRAAREVVGTTPIVFTVVFEPVGEGFAASLARPGGTITGLTQFLLDLMPRRLHSAARTRSRPSAFAR